jgi:hypothetical protein
MWAWGPRPCGPQPQKAVATHGGWTARAIKWGSSEFDPVYLPQILSLIRHNARPGLISMASDPVIPLRLRPPDTGVRLQGF